MTFEAGPEVGDEDLGALEDADGLPPGGVRVDVGEAGEVGSQKVDEGCGGTVGGVDEFDDGAIVSLVEDLAGLAETVETFLEERDLLVCS